MSPVTVIVEPTVERSLETSALRVEVKPAFKYPSPEHETRATELEGNLAANPAMNVTSSTTESHLPVILRCEHCN